MPTLETPFASRFAQLRDKFRVLWTIIHQPPRSNERPGSLKFRDLAQEQRLPSALTP
jgi:hypothetical protein